MEEKILVTRSSMPSYDEYIELIKPLWDTHWLTNMGIYHQKLEQKLKEYLEIENISLMVNGHMALELAIQAMEFPEGSEVITTPFTFISTTHAIIRNKLVPVFCDIKESDYTIDETKIEELITEKTVAIVPVHVYGNVCNVEEIEKIARKYNLKVLYDAAHAFGVKYKGHGIGSYGDASVFSFHATKVFNTIEGGAVCYKEKPFGDILYNLKNFGIRSEELVVSIGANAKMNEFSAAMGLCNINHVDDEISKRKRICERYMENLKDMKGITVKEYDNKFVVSNYAYFPIYIDSDKFGRTRDEIFDELRLHNIYSRKYFYPLTSEQACFKNKYKKISIPVARRVSSGILTLPLYGELELENVDRICTIIKGMR